MKSYKLKGALVIFMAITLWGCTKQNEESLVNNTGTVTCDTVNMTYAVGVMPIIRTNCYSCHGNGVVTASISLDSYVKLKRQVDNNSLLAVINHTAGYPQMPYGLPKLSSCDINKITAWINRGALNN